MKIIDSDRFRYYPPMLEPMVDSLKASLQIEDGDGSTIDLFTNTNQPVISSEKTQSLVSLDKLKRAGVFATGIIKPITVLTGIHTFALFTAAAKNRLEDGNWKLGLLSLSIGAASLVATADLVAPISTLFKKPKN